MNKRVIRIVAIFALVVFGVFGLASCGAKGSGYPTTFAQETSKGQSFEKLDSVSWAEHKVADIIIQIEIDDLNKIVVANQADIDAALAQIKEVEDKITVLKDEINKIDKSLETAEGEEKTQLENEKAEKEEALVVEQTNLETVKAEKLTETPSLQTYYEKNEMVAFKETAKNVLTAKEKNAEDYANVVSKVNALVDTPEFEAAVKAKLIEFIKLYTDEANIAGSDKKDKIDKNFKVELIRADTARFESIITNKVTSFTFLTDKNQLKKAFETKSFLGGCSGTPLSNKDATILFDKYNDVENLKDVNIYETLMVYMLSVTIRINSQEPIKFDIGGDVGEFFANFFDNFFVFPVGIVLHFLTSIFGGWYILGLLITTLLIRTAGWPIYAKTNDMSLKMQVLQPEMQKINDKYANRQDPDSQRMKQAEIGQLYKKHKVGIGGCFLPFLQFPIFMAVYGAVRRFPYTIFTEGTSFVNNWANETIWGKEVNSTLFGLNFDLFEDYATGGTSQLVGIIILVILVCGTQFLSQFLSERRQKKNTQRQQEDIPAYRRQAYKSQNNQGQNTMKYVMYMMIFMMGTFVFTSKAGLGVYWLIGNLYSMLQMFINNELGQRKLKKLRESKSEYR